VSAILLGCCVGFFTYWMAYHSADDKGDSGYARSLKTALTEAANIKETAR